MDVIIRILKSAIMHLRLLARCPAARSSNQLWKKWPSLHHCVSLVTAINGTLPSEKGLALNFLPIQIQRGYDISCLHGLRARFESKQNSSCVAFATCNCNSVCVFVLLVVTGYEADSSEGLRNFCVLLVKPRHLHAFPPRSLFSFDLNLTTLLKNDL